MKILTNLDISKNELINASIQKLPNHPQSPVLAQIYFNTTDYDLYIYNGTEWVSGTRPVDEPITVEDIEGLYDLIDLKADKKYVDDRVKTPVPLDAKFTDTIATKESIGLGRVDNTSDLDKPVSTATQQELDQKASKAYVNDRVKTPVPENAKFTDTIATKQSLGLGKVDNTSDLDKPLSYATKSALSEKADKTELAGEITTVLTDSKGYTDSRIKALVGEAPETLDTLQELAEALGKDHNFSTTVANALAKKTEKYSENIGNGTKTSFKIAHKLGSEDVLVQIRTNSNPSEIVYTTVVINDSNSCTVNFAKAPKANEYRVVVIG